MLIPSTAFAINVKFSTDTTVTLNFDGAISVYADDVDGDSVVGTPDLPAQS
ncbi:MAG: hypothetical protein ACUZ8H_02995 [Candidatus Anammoxibacter sp.]